MRSWPPPVGPAECARDAPALHRNDCIFCFRVSREVPATGRNGDSRWAAQPDARVFVAELEPLSSARREQERAAQRSGRGGQQGSEVMTSVSRDDWLACEWLEADGLGGFASGTVPGIRTRRYHALLLVAT